MNEALKSIKYSQAEAVKLEKLSLKLGRPQRLVFLQMVEYFYRTKKDPLDINDELLKNTLLKQHKDYIGFIKTQENDLLIPTKREVERLIESQKTVIQAFQKLMAQNEQVPVMINKQNQFLDQLDLKNRKIAAMLQEKEKLKKLFIEILDGYAAARENVPAIMAKKEKELLLERTRKQISLL